MVALALLLAAVNQCFSMLDPYIYGKILNKFGVGHETYKGDISAGLSFDGDKGHILGSVSYSDSPNEVFDENENW